MKKLLLTLLLCGCIVWMCACTGQMEAVAFPTAVDPATAVRTELITISVPQAAPEQSSPAALDISSIETAAAPETEETISVPTPPAAIEDVSSVVRNATQPQSEIFETETVQKQTPAVSATSITPAALKSSVSWNPAPRQTSTPIPKISVDFVITCPPEPTLTPEMPLPTETPVAQPSTTPVVPDAPATPVPEQPSAPEPTPDPAPVPTPTPEPAVTPKPSGGYAVCSCGATILPDELVAHMKAHALKGESHSYVAY